MKRNRMKVSLAWILVCLIVVSGSIETKAYFDRGPVYVSVGKSSVSLKQGQSETVSVTFSPSKSSQLPGCGMAECPQSCGEKECLDENGECTCNGTTYQTYYAFAKVSSSNTSVATAEYNSGSVKIKGISAGTATITVTASLRQFSSTSTTIKVTVLKAAEETKETVKETTKAETTKAETTKAETTKAETKAPTKAESSAASQNSGTSGSNSGSVSAVQVTGETTKKDESGKESSADNSGEESVESVDSSEESTEAASSVSGEESSENNDNSQIITIQSDRGSITFVPITAGKIGGAQLESILGEKAYVDFQKKDEAGTVLYAWEFCGTDLKKAEDLDFSVEMSKTPFEGCENGNTSDSLFLSFGHSGELPGVASLYIRVSDQFSDDQMLNLYSYEENQIKCLAENLAVENGYVTLTLDRCSDCILSAGTWEEGVMKSTGKAPWIWGICAAAVIGAAAVIFLRSRKGSHK